VEIAMMHRKLTAIDPGVGFRDRFLGLVSGAGVVKRMDPEILRR
jgi:hypothetical protein